MVDYKLLRDLQTQYLHRTLYFLAGMMSFILFLMIFVFGKNFFLGGVFTCFALILLWPSMSDRLVLKAHKAIAIHPHSAPELFEMIHSLGKKAHLPVFPKVYLLPSSQINAFTIGRRQGPSLAISQGALSQLNGRELMGVLAHEVAHIKGNDLNKLKFANFFNLAASFLTVFGVVMFFINLPLYLLGLWSFNPTFFLLLLAAPNLGLLLSLALSRNLEYVADLEAVALTHDPLGLASALLKINTLQSGGAWPFSKIVKGNLSTDVWQTHPAISNRLFNLKRISNTFFEWEKIS